MGWWYPGEGPAFVWSGIGWVCVECPSMRKRRLIVGWFQEMWSNGTVCGPKDVMIRGTRTMRSRRLS